MYNYIFKKSFFRFKRSFRQYLTIMIEVFIGIFILGIFLNISMSLHNDYQYMLSKGDNLKFEILFSKVGKTNGLNNFDLMKWGQSEATPFEYKDESILPFDYQDCITLQQKFADDANVMFFIRRCLYYNDKKRNISKSFYMFFVSDKLFLELYKKPKTDYKIALVGYDAHDVLNKNNVLNKRDIIFNYSGSSPDKLIMNNGDKLEIHNLSATNNKETFNYLLKGISIESENQINTNSFIIIPIKYYYDFLHPKDIPDTHLQINLNNSSQLGIKLTNIIQYLNNKHGNQFSYTIDSELNKYIKTTETIRDNALFANIVTFFSLVVIIIGLSGLMLLLVNKRIKEYAISIALGATKKVIFLETLMEATIVCLIGGVLGTILETVVLSQKIICFNEFMVVVDNKVQFICIFAPILIGVLSTMFSMVKIVKLMPIEILKSL
ncbi:MAG: hypothetical protein Q8942_13575 [Bacillota bacterium]|nr:hypothetical protein [Bacillota bacterium]